MMTSTCIAAVLIGNDDGDYDEDEDDDEEDGDVQLFTCIAVVLVAKVGFEVFLSVDPRLHLFKHIMNMINIEW